MKSESPRNRQHAALPWHAPSCPAAPRLGSASPRPASPDPIVTFLLLLTRLTILTCVLPASAHAHTEKDPQANKPAPVPPPNPPLVLAGGTVIDVSAWGKSTNDIHDAVVYIREGRITAVGPRATLPIPKGSKVIDCTGKYLVPGLVDGYAGMNSPGQAKANLYMGVTTVVAASDDIRGRVDQRANPAPHLYMVDSIGSTDDWSLLISRPEWATKLADPKTPPNRPVELTPEDTARQLADTAKIGTRVLWIGHNITAANTQWIIERAHQAGMVTYGEFAATPYRVGIAAGVDVLLHMGRYELGFVPDELQQPLMEDPEGTASRTAYGYSERLPPSDFHIKEYARFIATHHAALMPTLSVYYLRLPNHRNLWLESAAQFLDPKRLSAPPDMKTGEATYPLPLWSRRLPNYTLRWMEDSARKKADQEASRLWDINKTILEASPHYLAASGSPASGTMPGISLHTELELLVNLGLTPREALAAATDNYSEQLRWHELGQITPGRRADILVLDDDPTVNIWNTRHISTLFIDGNQVDREGLLKK